MRLLFMLTYLPGIEYPWGISINPDDNFGDNYDENELVQMVEFKTEQDAKEFIRNVRNAPILKQEMNSEGELLTEEYIRDDSELIQGFRSLN